MNSVVRAGHLAPYFKASSSTISNGLKPVVAVATPVDKLVSQTLPITSTVQSLHGSLPIQGLKAKHSTRCKYVLLTDGLIIVYNSNFVT